MARPGSVAQIAALLDVTPRRVQQLAAEGVIPKADGGEYNPPQCVVRYIRHLRQRIEGGGTLTLTDERTRLARAQADEKELELELRRSELVSTEWIVGAFGRVMETFRTRMLAIPSKVAPAAFECSRVAEVKT